MAFFERGGEILGMVFKVIAAIVLLFSLLGFLGGSSFFCEMFVNYRAQLLVVSIVVFIMFIILRAWIWLLVIAVAVFVNAMDVVPCYAISRAMERGEETETVTFLVANVRQDNEDFEGFIEKLQYEDADVIFLQEINSQWQFFLAKHMAQEYNNYFPMPAEDRTGKVLMSRLPFQNIESIELGERKAPGLLAKVKILNHTVNIVGVHLTPPTNTGKFEARNEQLSELTELVNKLDGLVVVLGNLNASTFSPAMKEFVEETGLMDARKGHGVLATWPAYLPTLKIPIGNCMLSEGIGVKSIRLGDACGSDHVPIIVEVGITGSELRGRDR